MASISEVLRYDALDGSLISPLTITASKVRTTLVRDAVDTQDLCDSPVTHLCLCRFSTAQLYAIIYKPASYAQARLLLSQAGPAAKVYGCGQACRDNALSSREPRFSYNWDLI
ncbi:uncharacterized protein HD556DRAFT_1449216 [Suillus plorans]|uniref:Uncharacterized protein n=1 Tax=Suillus plorans TaxID=116603 RepID=A0A9P7DCA4_9AGAM|nr:uncharacterized protein HD556DRAFT_1449216 [Suillus plorans]KAG1787016.1 hypothetical protein HD556DRAFT_1449216 [Suillus plorans]